MIQSRIVWAAHREVKRSMGPGAMPLCMGMSLEALAWLLYGLPSLGAFVGPPFVSNSYTRSSTLKVCDYAVGSPCGWCSVAWPFNSPNQQLGLCCCIHKFGRSLESITLLPPGLTRHVSMVWHVRDRYRVKHVRSRKGS